MQRSERVRLQVLKYNCLKKIEKVIEPIFFLAEDNLPPSLMNP